jgi:hypothetical protein
LCSPKSGVPPSDSELPTDSRILGEPQRLKANSDYGTTETDTRNPNCVVVAFGQDAARSDEEGFSRVERE